MQFIGVKWNNILKTPQLNVRLSPEYENEERIEISFDKPLTIEILSEKHCIGYYRHPDYVKEPCSANKRLTVEEAPQCSICRGKESTYFMPFNYLSTEQILEVKKQPHLNYVALFGDNILKVGVAALVRKYTRILEQGSWASLFFTDCDGYVARQIEAIVSRTLHIRQTVNFKSKIKLLKQRLEINSAEEKLIKIYQEIVSAIPKEYLRYIMETPEFSYNMNYYQLNFPDGFTEIEVVNKLYPGDIISGNILGVMGEIIILETNNSAIYAINTKNLLGYSIEFSHKKKALITQVKPEIIGFESEIYEPLKLF